MCLLVVGFRNHRNFPIYLAANREEEIKRKTTLPKVFDEGRIVIAGLDEREEGTWLGANGSSLVAAICNRQEKGTPGKKRSRGLLVLEVLRQENMDQIQPLVKKLAKYFKPFNLFFGNPISAYVMSWNGKRLSTEKLQPGHHVITKWDLDDRSQPKVARAFELLEKKPDPTLPQDVLPSDWLNLFYQLIQISKDHEPNKDLKETLCRHDKPVKTVSSSLFALANRGINFSYFWHLVGNPCQASYRDYTGLLKKVVSSEKKAATSPVPV